jgi:hypothetical protein
MAPNHYDFAGQWRALGEEVAVGDVDARCTRGGSVGVLLLALPMQPMAPLCPCRPCPQPPKRRTGRRPTTPGAAFISAESHPLAPAQLPPQNFDGDPTKKPDGL